MNIVMITNYPPRITDDDFKKSFVNEGWVESLQNELLKKSEINMFIIYPQKKSKQAVEEKISDNFSVFGFYNDNSEQVEDRILDVLSCLKIDVIHIMGTEFPHALYAYNACEKLGLDRNVVVSIQGLVSYCAKHYLFGVPTKYTLGFSLVEVYDCLSSMRKLAKGFQKRGMYEEQLLKKCKHVIGRTSWDNKCVRLYNPNVRYYFNGENLRDEFYDGNSWNINTCEKYSIFVSQATYSLKGLHHVLMCLPQIIQRHPDTKLYVGGTCPISPVSWKRSSYAKYLCFLIKKGNLEKHVIFCGKLSANEMKNRYLNAHIFLSPSNVENSSNSIGEALMLGTPVVASDVGGTDSIITNGIEGLTYPLNEPYVMVQNILDIFSNDKFALQLSNNERKRAQKQYNRNENVERLMKIYHEVGRK